MENDEFEMCDCGMAGCMSNLFKEEYRELFKHISIDFMKHFAHSVETYLDNATEHELILEDYTDDLDFDNPDWLLWEWEFLDWQSKKTKR